MGHPGACDVHKKSQLLESSRQGSQPWSGVEMPYSLSDGDFLLAGNWKENLHQCVYTIFHLFNCRMLCWSKQGRFFISRGNEVIIGWDIFARLWTNASFSLISMGEAKLFTYKALYGYNTQRQILCILAFCTTFLISASLQGM